MRCPWCRLPVYLILTRKADQDPYLLFPLDPSGMIPDGASYSTVEVTINAHLRGELYVGCATSVRDYRKGAGGVPYRKVSVPLDRGFLLEWSSGVVKPHGPPEAQNEGARDAG